MLSKRERDSAILRVWSPGLAAGRRGTARKRKGTRERDEEWEERMRRRRRKGSSRDPAALPFNIITRLTNFLVS